MQLYGVVTKKMSPVFITTIPIFKEYREEKYCEFIYEVSGKIMGTRPIDITRYGRERYLPLSKRDLIIQDEYLVKWDSKKCIMRAGLLTAHEVLELSLEEWLNKGVSITICDNEHFLVCQGKGMKEIEEIYLQGI